MKVNITDLLIFFDEQLPESNEEQGIYWFKTIRSDGVSVVFIVSIYEAQVVISVRVNQTTTTRLVLKNCSEVRILDEKRKCLEILHEDTSRGRCFVSLLEKLILEYEENT